MHVDGETLHIGEESIDLRRLERIAVVGAGKAGGAMAVAIENVLGPKLLDEKRVSGWINVPADCVVPTARIHLHPGRPAGVNEPRPEGVEGTGRILNLVESLGPADLCLCVIAGGGSALLPAPVPEISLEDKLRVTQLLSAAGANIEQLNTVRRELSLVKGGGLAAACRAGRLISLIISDVLGDPLDAIASGPTLPSSTTAADALAVLSDLRLINEPTIRAVTKYLRVKQRRPEAGPASANDSTVERHQRSVTNLVLASNATAVDASGVEAERLGYSHAMISGKSAEGPADDAGRHLAEMALRMRGNPGPDCLISGGEPTVKLAEPGKRGKGGRNQQLALAALARLGDSRGIALLAGGTDGEDGPTDAAGAFVTEEVARTARERQLEIQDFLERNDAYHFFQASGGLFVTGPTHTNVCDLRVIAVDRRER